MNQAQKDRLDAERMRSMARSIRQNMAFSFNPLDMAEMLERTADRIQPGPKFRVRAGTAYDSKEDTCDD